MSREMLGVSVEMWVGMVCANGWYQIKQGEKQMYIRHKNWKKEAEKANARAGYLARQKRRERRAAAARSAIGQCSTDQSVFATCTKMVTTALRACKMLFRKVG